MPLLLNNGCENELALECILRHCGYLCELYRLKQGSNVVVVKELNDWIVQ